MAMPAAHCTSGSTMSAAVSSWCSASHLPRDAAARSATSAADSPGAAARASGLGTVAPSGDLEFHGELGSTSARALAAPLPRPTESAGPIQLRELQS